MMNGTSSRVLRSSEHQEIAASILSIREWQSSRKLENEQEVDDLLISGDSSVASPAAPGSTSFDAGSETSDLVESTKFKRLII
jgi:hypothetical protein